MIWHREAGRNELHTMNEVERELKRQHARLDQYDRQRALNDRRWQEGVEIEDWIGEDGRRVKPRKQLQKPQPHWRYRIGFTG